MVIINTGVVQACYHVEHWKHTINEDLRYDQEIQIDRGRIYYSGIQNILGASFIRNDSKKEKKNV